MVADFAVNAAHACAPACTPCSPAQHCHAGAPCLQVAFAKKNGSIIVYDAAYALYISDDNCPKTIYEIPGGWAGAKVWVCPRLVLSRSTPRCLQTVNGSCSPGQGRAAHCCRPLRGLQPHQPTNPFPPLSRLLPTRRR